MFAVEVTKSYQRENWVEDMQRLLTQAGAELKETAMLVTDAQVKKPFVLEDLNSLLDCGEIPNLFTQETFIPIADKVRANAKKEGRTRLAEAGTTAQLYDYFVECVKRKLHIVLLQSPVGDALRTRIRMFPNVVNCTTIVWYRQWPDEGLQAVAEKAAQEMFLEVMRWVSCGEGRECKGGREVRKEGR